MTADVNDSDFEESMREATAGEVDGERATRFYDRIRKNIHEYTEKKSNVLGKTAEFLLLVPDVFILLWRLANDARVSGKNKVLLASSIAYYIFPFDIIPEAFVGPIGYMDDLVFGVYVLNKLLGDVDASVLRQHWSGSEDVLAMIQRVLHSAESLTGGDFVEKVKRMVK